jgi:hypothetical protein
LDDLIELSPTLVRQIAQIRRLGWSIEPGLAGEGTWADIAHKRIVVDASAFSDKYTALTALVHEVHHALYANSVARDVSSKEAFVRYQMASEGASGVNEVEVLLEVALNGKARVPDQTLENIAGPLSIYAPYLEHKDYTRLIHEIGALFEQVQTSIGERYRPYYERMYDQQTVNRNPAPKQQRSGEPAKSGS